MSEKRKVTPSVFWLISKHFSKKIDPLSFQNLTGLFFTFARNYFYVFKNKCKLLFSTIFNQNYKESINDFYVNQSLQPRNGR